MIRPLPISVITCFLMVGCGNSPSSDQPQRRPPVYVEVERATKAPIVATISATGTITAKNEVKVIAQAEGKVIRLTVEEGDVVRKGDLLVKLDDSILLAQTKEAEATMEDARASYERMAQLFEAKLVSQQEYDQARTRYNVARARYELQQALLGYTTITAPISGVITYRGIREGDIAVPRTILLVVSDPSTLVMEINVSEIEVPRIAVNDSVKIRVDAYPNAEFRGIVRRIFPSSDPVSRLVKVEVELTQKDRRLFPGLFARAELTTATRSDAIVLTNDAIVTSSTGQHTAFVVVDSVVERRRLRLGIRDGRRSEVLEGVRENEKVVVVGQDALNDRMVVTITRER